LGKRVRLLDFVGGPLSFWASLFHPIVARAKQRGLHASSSLRARLYRPRTLSLMNLP